MQGYPFLTFADRPAQQKIINPEIFSWELAMGFDWL